MEFPELPTLRLHFMTSLRLFKGSGGTLEFSKLRSQDCLRINFKQKISLSFPRLLETFGEFPDFLAKFPDFQSSISTSLSFTGFPSQ